MFDHVVDEWAEDITKTHESTVADERIIETAIFPVWINAPTAKIPNSKPAMATATVSRVKPPNAVVGLKRLFNAYIN